MSRSLHSTTTRNARGRRSGDAAMRATALPPAQRVFFERAYGHDFSQVRVHTDPAAQALAQSMRAKAVTSGEDIAFASGRYQPDSMSGRTLLGHELAHVAQQRQVGGGASAQAEVQARSAAQTANAGGSVSPAALGSVAPGLHCDPDDSAKDPGDTARKAGPALPQFKLSTPGPIDWLKLRESFDTRGMRLSLRDADSIEAESRRIAGQLEVFGIGQNFKLNYGLGTLTRDDIINIGLSRQLEDRLGSENPNSWDRMDKDWKQSHPDGFATPILSKTWKF